MINKILITGVQGLVGSRFVELYANRDELLTPGISEFDFLDPSLMKKYLKGKNVGCVINFAAYTDVGGAEKQRGNNNGMCWKVNVSGIQNLIKLFNKKRVFFIHISTDMVFPGNKEDPGPYEENHKLIENPDKLTWYGYTKGEGERIIKGAFKNYAILRIIYPVRAKYDMKLDFLRKPLKLYNEGKLYPLFKDQQINITFIDEACKVINKLIKEKKTGMYHCSSCDTTSPYEIVKYLIEAKYSVKDDVKSISIYDFLKDIDNPVRYPIFSGLKVVKTEKALGIIYSSWKGIVDQLIRQNITP